MSSQTAEAAPKKLYLTCMTLPQTARKRGRSAKSPSLAGCKPSPQGAKVRSPAAFVKVCSTKSSDVHAQQKPSSNRRIADSKAPKLRNRVHCQQTISALDNSQAKLIRQNFLPVIFPAAIIHCRDKYFIFCLSQTFTSRTSNLEQPSTA